MNIGYDIKDYPDGYLLIKEENIQAYLSHDISCPSYRFRGRDKIDFSMSSSSDDTTTTYGETLTIETPANFDFAVDDLIVDLKAKTLWRILPGIVVADDNQQKKYLMRPRKITILPLGR